MANDDYDLREHIHPIDLVAGFDGVFDQRQITIYTYSTSLPFERQRIRAALEGAWLGPAMNLGVVQFLSPPEEQEIRVVLGFQAESKVRTFDYDKHRARWWAWRPTIRDTIAIRYSADSGGMLRFTTIGGGLRIRTGRLKEFHSLVLGIPRDASRTLSFDPHVLGRMWFEPRFIDRLYSLKARLLDAKRYGSIEHAEFASQRYLDPDCDVLLELRGMTDLPVEAFESVVTINAMHLGGELDVRFAIRATSGALRLNLPTFEHDQEFRADDEQTRAFYDFVEAVASVIVQPEMFLLGQIDPALADHTNPMFPEQLDTAEYREYLRGPDTRRWWFDRLDTSLPTKWWVPHMHAANELLAGEMIAGELSPIVAEFARREPADAVRALNVCRRHGWVRMGALMRDGLVTALPELPVRAVTSVEEAVLDYGFEHDDTGWDIVADTASLVIHGLTFPLADLRPGAAARGLLVAARSLHAGALADPSDADIPRRAAWAIARIPNCGPVVDADGALRLLVENLVPRTVTAFRALHPRGPQPPDVTALDDLLFTLHRLPLWPSFEATAAAGGWTLKNVGGGHATDVRIAADGVDVAAPTLLSGGEVIGKWPAGAARPTSLSVTFVKAATARRVLVPLLAPIAAAGSLFAPGAAAVDTVAGAPVASARPRKLDRRQVAARLRNVDPAAMPIGGSPELQGVIEQLLRANIDAAKPAPILLLGETGVGKTTLFRLLHATSGRRTKQLVIASGSEGAGGDPSLQRGVWIGFGKGHGLPGIHRDGQTGKFDDASGSTLFIDDCEQLGLVVQGDLLALLEGRPVGRIGKGNAAADARVVFATNADPEVLVREGKLRHDLLARIPVANRIVVPPLRDRPLDVLPLAREFAKRNGVRLTDRALLALFRRAWKENVRELELFILTAAQDVKLEDRKEVDLRDLPIDADLRSAIEGISAQDAEREIWTVASNLAMAEGFVQGHGLQKVAGEIVGVSEGEASKVYERLGWRGV